MKRIILLSILISFLLIHPLYQEQPFEPATQPEKVEAKALDPRAQILKDYLAKYDSPLESHAQDFIDAADKYQLDWKLVPAIAGVESTFGKNIPGGYEPGSTSYNGWGWGVYGDQALFFTSWKNGIFTVAEGLKEKYVNKGLINPYQMNTVYAASPTWGTHVSYFIEDLDQYAKNFQKLKLINPDLKSSNSESKTAGTSAQLSFGI